MADIRTVARPYARAIFEIAHGRGQLDAWSEQLAILAAVAEDASMQPILDDPTVAQGRKADLILEILEGRADSAMAELVRVLAENDRLEAFSSIRDLYEGLRAEAQRTLTARVVTAQPVTSEQQTAIAEALQKRLGREVQLEVAIDGDLIGGAIIEAGDLVIDGSVRGRLENLASTVSR